MAAYGATDGQPPRTTAIEEPDEESAVLPMAARGFRLLPVEAGGKRPLIPEWPEKATCDAETLSAWQSQYPGCNWGLACGSDSGVFVLDVDGDEGAAAIRELCSTYGDEWMDTLTAITARGLHLYYQCPEGAHIRNSTAKLARGLNVRGEGGYVVVPPLRPCERGSVHLGWRWRRCASRVCPGMAA